jgi:hypothetical protein
MNLKTARIRAIELAYGQQGGAGVYSFLSNSQWDDIFRFVVGYLANLIKMDISPQRLITIPAEEVTLTGYDVPNNWLRIQNIIEPKYTTIIPSFDFEEMRKIYNNTTPPGYVMTQQHKKLMFGAALIGAPITMVVLLTYPLFEDSDSLPFDEGDAMLIYSKVALMALERSGKGSPQQIQGLRNSIASMEYEFVAHHDVTRSWEAFQNPAFTDRMRDNLIPKRNWNG